MGRIAEGEKAPDFSLMSQDGRMVTLREFQGRKNVILYFYPKDFTIGCTTEAKTFGVNYDRLLEMGVEIVGVSSDTSESHRSFGEKCGVKFPLLSDEGGKVRSLYGVKASFGIVPGRVTFVIDKAGVVRRVVSSQTNPRRHVTEALEVLQTMQG